MKKTVTIILWLISCISIAYTQSSTEIYAGMNLATMSGNNETPANTSLRVSGRIGMAWNFNFLYSKNIEFGLFYSQQGAIFKYEHFEFNRKVLDIVKYKIDYMQIPLIWKENYRNIYTKLGIYSELAVTAQSKWYSYNYYKDYMVVDTGEYISFKNNLRSYDMGIYLGFGFQFPTRKNITYLIDFNFIHGFFPILESDYNTKMITRNMVFNISLGILFEQNKNSYHRKRRR